MGEEASEMDWKKRREDWLNRLLDELLKVEKLFPVNLLPEGEYPEWVRRLEREIGATLFRVLDPKAGMDLTPRKVAALLGHRCANAVFVIEWMNSQTDAVQKLSPKETPKEDSRSEQDSFATSISDWYSALRRLAKRALCSCVDQLYEDMTEFLKAYADAFSRKPKPDEVGQIGNTNFDVHLLLFLYWRQVERLKSVPELHAALVKRFGAHRTGDLKRIEKICQRIGLSFRKVGRPKK